ncbi:MAG: hypothetical protein PHV87_02515, partial [Bacilli bacterium]|nr:hypothetical protein [Bacilli bacterium]
MIEGESYYYNYDLQNRLITITTTSGNNVTYGYNPDGLLRSKSNVNGSDSYYYIPITETEEGKNANKVIDEEYHGNHFIKKYNYTPGFEKLDFITIITQSASIITDYVYDTFEKNHDDKIYRYETLRVKEVNIKKNSQTLISLKYFYDNYGNIQTIGRYENGSFIEQESFYYDIYNQLERCTLVNYLTRIHNDIYYSYDIRGNLLSIVKKENSYTTSTIECYYQNLSWKDQLTGVNINGVNYYINYDSAGNPTNYIGFDGVSFNKQNLVRLISDNKDIRYTYNADGLRTSKNVNGTVTNYILEGWDIIKETRNGVTLEYYYDINDEIIGFSYNG